MLRRRAVDTSLPTSRLIIILSLFISVAASALAENEHSKRSEKVLYIWAQDQAQVAPDFLAVIDFDEQSPKYGRVINVVPVPPPGNTGNYRNIANKPHQSPILTDSRAAVTLQAV